MRIQSMLATAVLAGGLLVAPGAAAAESAAAQTATPAGAATIAAACKYRRVGNTWRCITPGAYCPKAAHLRYGYAKSTGKRYRCVRYSNGKWRWKRA